MPLTWNRVWLAAVLGMVLASTYVYTQQPPALIFGSVTTSAPSYTNGTTNQLSLTTAGGLRVMPSDAAGTSAFGTAAALADDTANPTMSGLAAFLMCYDGTNWDRCRSASFLEDSAHTNGDAGSEMLAVRRNVAASSTATDIEYATFNTDALGLLWSRELDPCTGIAWTTVPISVAADTAVITASASNRNYICGGMLWSNAAETLNVWEGTGTACGTSSAAIIGSTTEGNGVSMIANQGFNVTRTIRGIGTNVDTCIRVVTGNRIVGYLEVVQAP